ncbi:MAG TPA: hypothetical protein VGN60_11820 [Devosia sp.]|jgi:hypothetical protein|nr:hypothetical protein [Devosia sp.]
MPVFYRGRREDNPAGSILVRVFALPHGLSCVVSWPAPEPGLRVFSPTPSRPEMVADALPYALHLSERASLPVTVELEPGLDWQPEWGELRDWEDG